VSFDGTDEWVINAGQSLTAFPAGTGAVHRAAAPSAGWVKARAARP
jgi:hypothetical protein